MDYKRSNAPLNTVTRDVIKMSEDTGNVYETVCIIAKRANQIGVEMKHDLEKKLQEFASLKNDNFGKKFLKTESRLKSLVTTRNCPKQPLSQHRSTLKVK